MSLLLRVIACLVLSLLAGGAPAPPKSKLAGADRLHAGMTPAEVRQVLGPPQRVARQILYHRYLEQWVYNAPTSVRVEFDFPHGQPPRLVSVDPAGNEHHP
jgi:hypothetical protein